MNKFLHFGYWIFVGDDSLGGALVQLVQFNA